MPRDLELIRLIAIWAESLDRPQFSKAIEIPGFSPEQITEHCRLMVEHKLLDGSISAQRLSTVVVVRRLTWDGHDFLAAARNETIWKQVTAKLKQTFTSITFDLLKQSLLTAIKLKAEGVD